MREGEGKVSFGENALRKRSRVASAGTVVLNIGACAGDKVELFEINIINH